MKRAPIIGVMGGSAARPDTYRRAQQAGKLIAEAGAVLLCGGGGGVMEAAARGAKSAEPPGKTIGILPAIEPGQGQGPNPYIDLPVFTGLADARNYINVVTSDALLALEGGAGTLSEIALGLKTDTPVVCVSSWRFLHDAGFSIHYVDTPETALARAFELIGCARGETLDAPVRFPTFPSQEAHRKRLLDFVEGTSA